MLADLLQAYPNAQIEDSSMLERVEQIIEQATFINTGNITHKPDNVALTTRIMSLSENLSRQKRRLGHYQQFTGELRAQISQLANESNGMQRLADWVDQALASLATDDDTIDQPLANETFLRVMSAQATVIPSGHEFFVEGAESILEAGLRGGLALNYGCSNGNCGLCKMRVVSGEIRRIRHHDYSLSEAEKGLGYVLGCCCTAISDVVLEADEAQSINDIPRQLIPLRIKKIDRPDSRVLIVSTRTPRTNRLRFLAGQGANLSVEGVGSSYYPIASCPCDDMNLQFHIAIHDQDPVSTFLAESAGTNDQLMLEGPTGTFVLDENSPHSLVFIAEATGFATIKGLIEHAMALDVAERIFLFWIGDREGSHYLNNLCRAWNDALDNFDYIPLNANDVVNLEQLIMQQLEPNDPGGFDYYFCGGDGLRSQVQSFAEACKVPPNQILYDAV